MQRRYEQYRWVHRSSNNGPLALDTLAEMSKSRWCRREQRREAEDAGGLDHIKQLIESSKQLSVDVGEHLTKPKAPAQMEQQNTCADCKESIEEEGVVQKCCMMFHNSCWDTNHEGYFGRNDYILCVCRKRRQLDEQGKPRRYSL